jgi:hypothetical protein
MTLAEVQFHCASSGDPRLYRFRRIMTCSNPQSLAIFGISETPAVRFKQI